MNTIIKLKKLFLFGFLVLSTSCVLSMHTHTGNNRATPRWQLKPEQTPERQVIRQGDQHDQNRPQLANNPQPFSHQRHRGRNNNQQETQIKELQDQLASAERTIANYQRCSSCSSHSSESVGYSVEKQENSVEYLQREVARLNKLYEDALNESAELFKKAQAFDEMQEKQEPELEGKLALAESIITDYRKIFAEKSRELSFLEEDLNKRADITPEDLKALYAHNDKLVMQSCKEFNSKLNWRGAAVASTIISPIVWSQIKHLWKKYDMGNKPVVKRAKEYKDNASIWIHNSSADVSRWINSKRNKPTE